MSSMLATPSTEAKDTPRACREDSFDNTQEATTEELLESPGEVPSDVLLDVPAKPEAASVQVALSAASDPEIIKLLPTGSKVLDIEVLHGVSNWAFTARLTTETADGKRQDYFLKILDTPGAYDRVYGEYMSMTEIHKTLPSIAPQPYGYGKCHNQVKNEKGATSNAHFFLCDFLQLEPGMPDPVRLGKTLASLHKISESPTGKFGFHCTTFDGKPSLTTTWESSWTTFFTRLIKGVYQLDTEVNGVWPEFDSLMEVTVEKLIPRLLDPLTTNGRTIKPSLIHGDLWESNIGTDRHTREIYIYDACAYYAHHEKEIAIWRCEHHELDKGGYIEEYLKNFPASEPHKEFEDRGLLYSVETLLMYSAHYPGSKTREKAFNELTWPVKKYQKDWQPVQVLL